MDFAFSILFMMMNKVTNLASYSQVIVYLSDFRGGKMRRSDDVVLDDHVTSEPTLRSKSEPRSTHDMSQPSCLIHNEVY